MLLPAGAYASWLNPDMHDASVALGWLVPYAGGMRRYPVSTRINGVQNDDEECARPVEMLAIILIVVVGTIRLVGSHANTVFSSAASTIQ